MSAPPTVVVSVLNWNQAEHTEQCVRALLALDYPNLTICVTDNASREFPQERLAALSPQLQFFRHAENVGYAAGHQAALAYAQAQGAELFWLLNNDARVNADTLAELLAAYRSHGEGLYSSRGVDAEGRALPEVIWGLQEGQCTFQPIPQATLAEPITQRVANGLGYSMLIPLSVMDKHGFIDPSFFLYFEETDYCLRLLAQGVPSFWVGRSTVYHAEMGSTTPHPALAGVVQYYLYRNLYHVLRRHAPRRIRWHFLWDWGKRWLLRRSDRLTYHQALGIRHGLRGIWGKTLAPEDFLD